MLRADLDNENETIRNYRERVAQCEALGEYAIAEDIREILRQEQEHQIDLATALGIDVPDVSEPREAKRIGDRSMGPDVTRTVSGLRRVELHELATQRQALVADVGVWSR